MQSNGSEEKAWERLELDWNFMDYAFHYYDASIGDTRSSGSGCSIFTGVWLRCIMGSTSRRKYASNLTILLRDMNENHSVQFNSLISLFHSHSDCTTAMFIRVLATACAYYLQHSPNTGKTTSNRIRTQLNHPLKTIPFSRITKSVSRLSSYPKNVTIRRTTWRSYQGDILPRLYSTVLGCVATDERRVSRSTTTGVSNEGIFHDLQCLDGDWAAVCDGLFMRWLF